MESDESDDEENHAAGGFKQTDSSVATPGGSTEPLPPKGPGTDTFRFFLLSHGLIHLIICFYM